MSRTIRLDQGLLPSWGQWNALMRQAWLTAMLIAEPVVISDAVQEVSMDTEEQTGYIIPPGRYGFARIKPHDLAGSLGWGESMQQAQESLHAVRMLLSKNAKLPDGTMPFGGRSLLFIGDGMLIPSYTRYAGRAMGNAERCRKWRERKAALAVDATKGDELVDACKS